MQQTAYLSPIGRKCRMHAVRGLQLIVEELAQALLSEFCQLRNQRQGIQTHEQFFSDYSGQRYVRGHD